MSTTIDGLRDIPLTTIDGSTTTLGAYAGTTVLVVNVASKCGLTPQYEQLEELQRTYGGRGFTVLGVPSNQFLGQEPGSNEEIQEFCSATYGVTFPLLEKAAVNGRNRHPLYKKLVSVKDEHGLAGPVAWNFEKFLVGPDDSVTRFRPPTKPDHPDVIAAIEAELAKQSTAA